MKVVLYLFIIFDVVWGGSEYEHLPWFLVHAFILEEGFKTLEGTQPGNWKSGQDSAPNVFFSFFKDPKIDSETGKKSSISLILHTISPSLRAQRIKEASTHS